MAEEPENLVLQMLRDIRGKLDDHSRMLEQHGKRLDEVQETALLGVGLATMANHKLDKVTEDHERRIAALEDRERP